MSGRTACDRRVRPRKLPITFVRRRVGILLLLCLPLLELSARPIRLFANRFEYNGPESRLWIVSALQETLNHNFSRINALEVPDNQDYLRVLELRKHEWEGRSDLARTEAILKVLKVHYLLNGVLSQKADGRLLLKLYLNRLSAAGKPTLLETYDLDGHIEGLPELALQIAEKILIKLATSHRIPFLEKESSVFSRRSVPRHKHFKMWAQGVELWSANQQEAHNLWAEVARQEPHFYLNRYWLGHSFQRKGQAPLALASFRDARTFLQKMQPARDKFSARLHWREAQVYYSIADYEKSHASLEMARDILTALGANVSDDAAEVANASGETYLAQGNLDAALQQFYRAKIIKDELNLEVTYNYARVLNNIATTLFAQGKFNNALTFYENELKIKNAMDLQNTVAYADTITNMGVVYMNLKQFKQAQDSYADSLELRKKIGDETSRGYADTLYNIGYFKILTRDLCGSLGWLEAGIAKSFAINPSLAHERLPIYNLARDGCRATP